MNARVLTSFRRRLLSIPFHSFVLPSPFLLPQVAGSLYFVVYFNSLTVHISIPKPSRVLFHVFFLAFFIKLTNSITLCTLALVFTQYPWWWVWLEFTSFHQVTWLMSDRRLNFPVCSPGQFICLQCFFLWTELIQTSSCTLLCAYLQMLFQGV